MAEEVACKRIKMENDFGAGQDGAAAEVGGRIHSEVLRCRICLEPLRPPSFKDRWCIKAENVAPRSAGRTGSGTPIRNSSSLDCIVREEGKISVSADPVCSMPEIEKASAWRRFGESRAGARLASVWSLPSYASASAWRFARVGDGDGGAPELDLPGGLGLCLCVCLEALNLDLPELEAPRSSTCRRGLGLCLEAPKLDLPELEARQSSTCRSWRWFWRHAGAGDRAGGGGGLLWRQGTWSRTGGGGGGGRGPAPAAAGGLLRRCRSSVSGAREGIEQDPDRDRARGSRADHQQELRKAVLDLLLRNRRASRRRLRPWTVAPIPRVRVAAPIQPVMRAATFDRTGIPWWMAAPIPRVSVRAGEEGAADPADEEGRAGV